MGLGRLVAVSLAVVDHGLSLSMSSSMGVSKEALPDASGASAVEKAYFAEQETVYDVDQGAFTSPAFWADVDENIPGWRTKPEFERFRGFCENLRTEPPGVDVFLSNGQQVLSQYVYPGLSGDDVTRTAYPHDAYPELAELRRRLEEDVAPVAADELAKVLSKQPLLVDEEAKVVESGAWDPLGGDGDGDGDASDETWQAAAWYGWQFLSLRGAKQFAPKVTKRLLAAMGASALGPAHRFVGFTRQKANCRGTVHSDGRNYMLSTLTPVVAPPGCGIFVNEEEAQIITGGKPVILDNTFPHYVYNDADEDRFVLMSECWHPALRQEEREALATLFAVKDRFTVLNLEMAPWGYAEDELAAALKSGAVHDLDYWKNIDYKPKKTAKKKAGVSARNNKKNAKKKAFG